ncbi:MAG: hypothetical protein K2Y18_02255 [Alphaproteobacteria bacterium]|jgi:TPR repeat protein|nr:hypothetical protein [Alphaproteobacteria bacterium]
MKKRLLILLSVLLSLGASLAIETLPEVIQKDVNLRPYVKGLLTSATFVKSPSLYSQIESPSDYKLLDFEMLRKGIFGEAAWVPQTHEFKSAVVNELFRPYFPKSATLDSQMVFLANVLYSAGKSIFQKFQDFTHIEHAASIGHAGAQLEMYLISTRARKQQDARDYLYSSAAQGNVNALLKLSSAYHGLRNVGIPKDVEVAKLLCQEASDLGSPEARFRIEVAPLTEGFFGSKKNFQQGVRKAKELADGGNRRAKSYIEAMMNRSTAAFLEADDETTDADLDFLEQFLGWKDDMRY